MRRPWAWFAGEALFQRSTRIFWASMRQIQRKLEKPAVHSRNRSFARATYARLHMTRIESRGASEAHWISTSTSRIRVRPCQCPGSNATWGWEAKKFQGAPCWVVFQGKPRGNQYCRGAKVLFLRAYCGWLFAFHVAAPKKSWLKPQRFLAGKEFATIHQNRAQIGHE